MEAPTVPFRSRVRDWDQGRGRCVVLRSYLTNLRGLFGPVKNPKHELWRIGVGDLQELRFLYRMLGEHHADVGCHVALGEHDLLLRTHQQGRLIGREWKFSGFIRLLRDYGCIHLSTPMKKFRRVVTRLRRSLMRDVSPRWWKRAEPRIARVVLPVLGGWLALAVLATALPVDVGPWAIAGGLVIGVIAAILGTVWLLVRTTRFAWTGE